MLCGAHDVAGRSPWERMGQSADGQAGPPDPKTLEYAEVPIPAGVAADEARCWALQIDAKDSCGFRRTQLRWLQYDINTGKFTRTIGQGYRADAGGNSMLVHPKWLHLGNSRKSGAHAQPGDEGIQVLRHAFLLSRISRTAPTGITVGGDGVRVWRKISPTHGESRPCYRQVEESRSPSDGWPIRAE